MNARQTLVGVCLLLAFAAGTAAERLARVMMEPADASPGRGPESAAAAPDTAIAPAKVTTMRVVYPSLTPGSTPTIAPPPETFSPVGSAVAAPAPTAAPPPVAATTPPAPVLVTTRPLIDASLRQAALQTLAREIEARSRTPAEPAEPLAEHSALAPEAVLPREKPSTLPRREYAAPGAIDLNTASLAELNTLRGVGRIGRSIIRGRPYGSTEDLVDKRILRRSAYERIRSQIAVR
jgi:DNA uptake protein ComE-like DNA-binding protein